jgi:hypothetical protein
MLNRCDQLTERAHRSGESLAAEFIAVAAPVCGRAHESLLAKSFKVVTDECLAKSGGVLDFLDGTRTVGEEHDHREAVLISERLQQRRQRGRAVPWAALRHDQQYTRRLVLTVITVGIKHDWCMLAGPSVTTGELPWPQQHG